MLIKNLKTRKHELETKEKNHDYIKNSITEPRLYKIPCLRRRKLYISGCSIECLDFKLSNYTFLAFIFLIVHLKSKITYVLLSHS